MFAADKRHIFSLDENWKKQFEAFKTQKPIDFFSSLTIPYPLCLEIIPPWTLRRFAADLRKKSLGWYISREQWGCYNSREEWGGISQIYVRYTPPLFTKMLWAITPPSLVRNKGGLLSARLKNKAQDKSALYTKWCDWMLKQIEATFCTASLNWIVPWKATTIQWCAEAWIPLRCKTFKITARKFIWTRATLMRKCQNIMEWKIFQISALIPLASNQRVKTKFLTLHFLFVYKVSFFSSHYSFFGHFLLK